uniref:Uncharacterized protein n=1 Tax=Rhizophora mucronata TaxID=61149 RepID=A0A2P2PVC8_RHIMU
MFMLVYKISQKSLQYSKKRCGGSNLHLVDRNVFRLTPYVLLSKSLAVDPHHFSH